MTIYYTLTFFLLASEVSPCRSSFVAILFIDATQRMWRIVAESEAAKSGHHGSHDVRTETNLATRKFYAQRNTYLTGFCLFLSLVLTRLFSILLANLDVQEQLAELKKKSATGAIKANGTGAATGNEVAVLRTKIAELERDGRDFETLKKQSRQQAEEYGRLASELNKYTGGSASKRD
ncbi:B-cell receptor-associated 31-like protein [Auriculariales sp. MPI-PUGE-AT-0066]|nr:B-cell receptor-associated 31-like protein [Auriculariales sp. MPI-PUGE-AT-0066]